MSGTRVMERVPPPKSVPEVSDVACLAGVLALASRPLLARSGSQLATCLCSPGFGCDGNLVVFFDVLGSYMKKPLVG